MIFTAYKLNNVFYWQHSQRVTCFLTKVLSRDKLRVFPDLHQPPDHNLMLLSSFIVKSHHRAITCCGRECWWLPMFIFLLFFLCTWTIIPSSLAITGCHLICNQLKGSEVEFASRAGPWNASLQPPHYTISCLPTTWSKFCQEPKGLKGSWTLYQPLT